MYKSRPNRGHTPTAVSSVKSLKVGYFKIYKTDLRPRAERINSAVESEIKVTLCSECGKPALRQFFDKKVGLYGRCKKHLDGAKVPYSYSRAKARND